MLLLSLRNRLVRCIEEEQRLNVARTVLGLLSAASLYAQAVPADWQQIGKTGEWKNTVAMAAMDGFI